ncbi:hypothetical protein IV454_00790 [Massilia antarctica]|uniref:Uncharacterized protein n=1 Tax=Massilia antarctica TaxID=2765360 RepID=A0AA48WD59_9BURK|nr:hypothetical protein [Massilia antarctica]QPI50213.1 hypothetical protein IV454_00790 [Massilia antarctica]
MKANLRADDHARRRANAGGQGAKGAAHGSAQDRSAAEVLGSFLGDLQKYELDRPQVEPLDGGGQALDYKTVRLVQRIIDRKKKAPLRKMLRHVKGCDRESSSRQRGHDESDIQRKPT